MSVRMETATEFWGGDVPDWVRALVLACDETGSSQNRVAGRLGYTGGVVSQIIRNAYPGNMSRIEERVRAIYMGGHIECPALGEISSAACLDWRDRSETLNSVSPMVVRMFRACRSCPRNAQRVEGDAA